MAECLRRPRRRLESACVLSVASAAAVFTTALREFYHLQSEEPPHPDAAHAIAKQRSKAT
jgi:hypothetical protein